MKPALRHLSRDETTVQFGTHPLRAVMLSGLSDRVRQWITSLDGTRDLAAVLQDAVRAGLDEPRARCLIDHLTAQGVLHDASAATGCLGEMPLAQRDRLRADLDALDLASNAPDGMITTFERRRKARVRVYGAGRVGAQIVALLAAAGVGNIRVLDPDPARPCDLTPGGLTWAEVGRPREAGAVAVALRLTAGDPPPPSRFRAEDLVRPVSPPAAPNVSARFPQDAVVRWGGITPSIADKAARAIGGPFAAPATRGPAPRPGRGTAQGPAAGQAQGPTTRKAQMPTGRKAQEATGRKAQGPAEREAQEPVGQKAYEQAGQASPGSSTETARTSAAGTVRGPNAAATHSPDAVGPDTARAQDPSAAQAQDPSAAQAQDPSAAQAQDPSAAQAQNPGTASSPSPEPSPSPSSHPNPSSHPSPSSSARRSPGPNSERTAERGGGGRTSAPENGAGGQKDGERGGGKATRPLGVPRVSAYERELGEEACRPTVNVLAGGPYLGDRTDRPDLVILAPVTPLDGVLVNELIDYDIPHLLVSAFEGYGAVGPLVLPGLTACVHCLDLARRDRDPDWGMVTAQLGGYPPGEIACDVALAGVVAAGAVGHALAFLDGRTPAVTNGTFEVTPEWQWIRRSWVIHPQCRCMRSKQYSLRMVMAPNRD